VNEDEQYVGEFPETQRFDLGDLYVSSFREGGRLGDRAGTARQVFVYAPALSRRSDSIFSRLRPFVSVTKERTKKRAANPMRL
jgi:hypothetical protein